VHIFSLSLQVNAGGIVPELTEDAAMGSNVLPADIAPPLEVLFPKEQAAVVSSIFQHSQHRTPSQMLIGQAAIFLGDSLISWSANQSWPDPLLKLDIDRWQPQQLKLHGFANC